MESLKTLWFAFLERNMQTEKDPQLLKQKERELINVPLLPLKMESNLLNVLWSEFIPLFLGQNANTVEIIIDETNKVSAIFLHRVNSKNIYIQLQPLDVQTAPLLGLDLLHLDTAFDPLKSWVKQEFNVEIGNIHKIQTRFLQNMNSVYSKYTSGLSRGDFLSALGDYCDLVTSAQGSGDLVCYPASNILDYFTRLRTFFGGFSFLKAAEFLKAHLPLFSITLTLWNQEKYIPFQLTNKKSYFKVDAETFDYKPTPEQDVTKQHELYLQGLGQKYKSKFNIFFNLKELMKIINDIIESPIPTEVKRFQFLMQQILYGYRNFGVYWNLSPKPSVFKSGPRFMLYASGMRLNLQKISYWAIPQLLEILINKIFGNRSRIIVVMGETWNAPNTKTIQACLFELENCYLHEFKIIPTEDFKSYLPTNEVDFKSKKLETTNKKRNPSKGPSPIYKWLNKIRGSVIDKYGYINAIVWLDFTVIENLLNGVIFDLHHNSLNGIKNLQKAFKLMKEPTHFAMDPVNEITSALEKMDEKSILQKIAALITDPHEF